MKKKPGECLMTSGAVKTNKEQITLYPSQPVLVWIPYVGRLGSL